MPVRRAFPIVDGHVFDRRLVDKRVGHRLPRVLVYNRKLHPSVVVQQRYHRFRHLKRTRKNSQRTRSACRTVRFYLGVGRFGPGKRRNIGGLVVGTFLKLQGKLLEIAHEHDAARQTTTNTNVKTVRT